MPFPQYRVCFVCSGNICRSPMAEVVLRRLVVDAGLADRVDVDSAGIGDWHIGERADRRALRALSDGGYDGDAHRARQFEPRWFLDRDLVIALDRGHERALRAWASNDAERSRVRLLRSFDPAVAGRAPGPDWDVPDPYYDGATAFTAVLHMVEASCLGLLAHIRAELAVAERG